MGWPGWWCRIEKPPCNPPKRLISHELQLTRGAKRESTNLANQSLSMGVGVCAGKLRSFPVWLGAVFVVTGYGIGGWVVHLAPKSNWGRFLDGKAGRLGWLILFIPFSVCSNKYLVVTYLLWPPHLPSHFHVSPGLLSFQTA